MLLILTGTIRPAKETEFLALRDEKERLRQYEESIRFFIRTEAFSKIIFCENSNYGAEKLSYLAEEAKERQVSLEILSFKGDAGQAKIHGKGFGEGEIMQHLFQNSVLLEGESFFVKVTGRLKVDNIKDIVSKIKEGQCYFNIPNRTHREMYDTKIYAMPVKLFYGRFLNVYDRVEDSKGIYLEKVYTAVIREHGIRVKNFPRFPRVTGVSASTGADYVYTEWKCKIRDVFSFLQFYKVGKRSSSF